MAERNIPSEPIDRVLCEKASFPQTFIKGETVKVKDNLELIENCAINGTWVLLSTHQFPSYWEKIVQRLEKLRKDNLIKNSFRLFFDLQGYKRNEIPDSFLFNHCVKFYMSEDNNEDMEGFNDVWANILNNKIVDKTMNFKPIVLS